MKDADRKQITSIINDVDDMTIATVRPDGYPQATTVSYVNEGLTIYFATGAHAQKAENIARNNKVSATIDRAYDNWNEIESLSLGGVAMRVTDPEEQEKISQLLFKKFPEVTDYEPEAPEEIVFFRLEPEVISLLDYAKGFGHTELFKV